MYIYIYIQTQSRPQNIIVSLRFLITFAPAAFGRWLLRVSRRIWYILSSLYIFYSESPFLIAMGTVLCASPISVLAICRTWLPKTKTIMRLPSLSLTYLLTAMKCICYMTFSNRKKLQAKCCNYISIYISSEQ